MTETTEHEQGEQPDTPAQPEIDDVSAAIEGVDANFETEATEAAIAEPSVPAAEDVQPVNAEQPQPATQPETAAPEPQPVVAETKPEAAAVVTAVAPADAVAPATGVSIWPFVAYDVLWAVFAGILIWQLGSLPEGVAVYESSFYPVAVLGGVVLTITGPLLALTVWLTSIGRPGTTKGGLFVSAMVRGSVATLIGVVLWWGALIVLDQIRLGSVL